MGGVRVDQFYLSNCAVCHGSNQEGGTAPALSPEMLTEEDNFYVQTIRDGRPGSTMPSWESRGLSEEEIRLLVGYLKSGTVPPVIPDSQGAEAVARLGLIAETHLTVSGVEAGTSVQLDWPVKNIGEETVRLVRLKGASLSLFHLTKFPIRINSGETIPVRFVVVPNPDTRAGTATASALAVFERIDGTGTTEVRLTVAVEIVEPRRQLAMVAIPVNGLPARMTAWGELVFVAYMDGGIDVFRFQGPETLLLVERIESILDTPNHGRDGEPSPDTQGRWIGGMTVGDDGTLYVLHSDPRLNEGTYLTTGFLADLNSGMLTALRGGPGAYDSESSRIDLVKGLPRNVTNHAPLGLALRDGWLYIAVGGMTDSGVPDPSKPDPDTELSGAILRLNLESAQRMAPITLAKAGLDFAGREMLQKDVLELWATGMRNGFGLTVHQGDIFLTDQGSDGGSAPHPLGEQGPSGISSNLTPDHLHRVMEGDFLGQPNQARGETILNDGSEYATPIGNPQYSPPLHIFGIHNSATGIVTYSGEAFPDLEGMLLVGKFSGGLGLQALRVEGDGVTDVISVASPPSVRNITDVAIGPNGEILLAEFWERRILISRRYANAATAVTSGVP
ncbi:MAG: PQQ-dependent sugar dehydrogenase [Chloroflexi bacterium]|nr:PQQ-dependent sugar dehydrogenase [Chloroflexota bacterium]MDA1218643.1 PQQ-dependent sugar dehydrogenase [Chloroflexota bacterium]PKB57229.1 MAG: hypothetical protein BZY73_04225 [SAR202 cluster bacterium Casp-Chloro-G3]